MGDYHAATPPGWDGRSPLPTVLFFHGYGSSGRNVVSNKGLMQAFGTRGILVIAPNGLAKTWAHQGAPSDRRDEMVFIDEVMADAKKRWPIDERLLWVSGFSQGGSMAWDLACRQGGKFAAFAPVAGAFWMPHPETCPGAPVHMRHIHGTGDTVVPMAGRPIRDRWHQGDVERSVAQMRRWDQCQAEPDIEFDEGSLSCRAWTRCGSGKSVTLCLHSGGHIMPKGWVDGAWRWVQSVADGS